jgi:hypothetical protein
MQPKCADFCEQGVMHSLKLMIQYNDAALCLLPRLRTTCSQGGRHIQSRSEKDKSMFVIYL